MTATLDNSYCSTRKNMCQAYLTLLLLSANSAEAEAALLETIETGNLDSQLGEGLLHSAVQLLLRRTAASAHVRNAPCLPDELKTVLELPTSLRQAYVLRMLCGYPIEICCSLLQFTEEEFECCFETAAMTLPLFERERQGSC